MNLIIAYLQYRWRTLFIVRKKGSFVSRIQDCHKKVAENIGFEQQLQAFRRKVSRSNKILNITDFGAGSKKLGNTRKVSDIYKTSVASRKYQRLLYQIIKEFKSESILEMGTSLGFSTVYLSKATSGKVRTIEACPEIKEEANTLFTTLRIENTLLINSTFSAYFELKNSESYDFVYIDGHHEGPALIKYIEILKPQLTDKAILVVDDIRWSNGMQGAWNNLCNDPSFSANVDFFRMGILQYSSVE